MHQASLGMKAMALCLCMSAISHPAAGDDEDDEATLWESRQRHAMTVFDEHLIVAGGYDSVNQYMFSDVWTSGNGIEWTRIAFRSFPARQLHGLTVLGNQLLLFGGSGMGFYWNDVWRSADGAVWSEAVASAPWSARRGMAGVVHKGLLFLIGGETMGENYPEYLNDVWASPDGASWEARTLTAPWRPRWKHAAVSFNDEIWMLGGAAEADTFSDVWHSADGITWAQGDSFPVALSEHQAAVYDKKIIVMGGTDSDGSLLSNVWASENGMQWQPLTASAAWGTRRGHAVAVHDKALWLSGGLTQGTDDAEEEVNDVWFSEDGATWKPASERGLFSCLGCNQGCHCDSGCSKEEVKSWRYYLGDWLLLGLSLLILLSFQRTGSQSR